MRLIGAQTGMLGSPLQLSSGSPTNWRRPAPFQPFSFAALPLSVPNLTTPSLFPWRPFSPSHSRRFSLGLSLLMSYCLSCVYFLCSQNFLRCVSKSLSHLLPNRVSVVSDLPFPHFLVFMRCYEGRQERPPFIPSPPPLLYPLLRVSSSLASISVV